MNSESLDDSIEFIHDIFGFYISNISYEAEFSKSINYG